MLLGGVDNKASHARMSANTTHNRGLIQLLMIHMLRQRVQHWPWASWPIEPDRQQLVTLMTLVISISSPTIVSEIMLM